MRYVIQNEIEPATIVDVENASVPVLDAADRVFYLREDFLGALDPRTLDLLVELGGVMGFSVRVCSLCTKVAGIRRGPEGKTHGICPECASILYPGYTGARG